MRRGHPGEWERFSSRGFGSNLRRLTRREEERAKRQRVDDPDPADVRKGASAASADAHGAVAHAEKEGAVEGAKKPPPQPPLLMSCPKVVAGGRAERPSLHQPAAENTLTATTKSTLDRVPLLQQAPKAAIRAAVPRPPLLQEPLPATPLPPAPPLPGLPRPLTKAQLRLLANPAPPTKGPPPVPLHQPAPPTAPLNQQAPPSAEAPAQVLRALLERQRQQTELVRGIVARVSRVADVMAHRLDILEDRARRICSTCVPPGAHWQWPVAEGDDRYGCAKW